MEKIEKIIFGLGSNLGDRQKFINLAIDEVQKLLNLKNIKKSTIIQNKALLLPNSPPEWNKDFLNIVFSGDINLVNFSYLEILEIVKKIEKKIGRKQRKRWAPREIDIDILAIGKNQVIIDDILLIPHQGLFERDFFINGFREIEPELFFQLKSFKNQNKK